MRCWKCGRELTDGASSCASCGAGRSRAAASSEVGKALRRLYDRCGAREVLSRSAYIVNGLGDLVEDAKKIRNLFRAALEAGVGKLYLEQLESAGKPDGTFVRRVRALLTDDAGLSDKAAEQLMGWFDEMIGWMGAAPRVEDPSAQDLSAGRPRRGGSGIIGIDLGTTFSRVAVMENGRLVIVPTPEGSRARPSVVGRRDDRMFICEDVRQSGVIPASTPYKSLIGGELSFRYGDALYSPQLVTALFLRKLRRDAERYLGRDVSEAVVTVPNCFTNIQRQAVLDAGRIAGLEIKRLINASSAAALGYVWQQKDEQAILVCCLGGGTFDVSVMSFGGGVAEVVTAAGDCALGGNTFDGRVAQWMAEEFQRLHGVDLSQDKPAMARLREAAERARSELSSVTASHIHVPYLTSGAQGAKHLDLTLKRAGFDRLTAPLIGKISGLIQQALKDAAAAGPERRVSKVDKVLLAGGASRIPAFREAVRRQAGGAELIGIQPDECTALGAAVQAGVISGDIQTLLLVDATALTLGLETAGGVYTPLICRNTTVPARIGQEFTTAQDSQSSVEVHVLQGEHRALAENVSLGKATFSGIPLARKGVARIEVTFDIDLNGMVDVTAEDKGTGKRWAADVLAGFRLSEEQVRSEARRAAQLVP